MNFIYKVSRDVLSFFRPLSLFLFLFILQSMTIVEVKSIRLTSVTSVIIIDLSCPLIFILFSMREDEEEKKVNQLDLLM